MDLSGIIFVVLAVAWAVYLIPKALKHHDEIARTRSVDRFSTAMRVLARREPVNRRDTRLVVTPARPGHQRMVLPTQSVTDSATGAATATPAGTATAAGTPAAGTPTAVVPATQRSAARAAARRRRHILSSLVIVAAVMCGVAGFGYLPWWSVSIPGGLVLAYLFLCRFQVRRERGPARTAPATVEDDSSASAPRRAVRVEAPYATPTVPVEEDATTAVEARQAETDLWDPLPITLPTYVDKPRAARTVRTIDLSQPNTWSSGRSEADSKLVEETAAARDEAAKAGEQQRAVGS